jgi:hypothetical protein
VIKARGETSDGRPVLVLGLSFANLDMLRAGKPIKFDGTPYGYPGTILIFAGATERAMAELIIATDSRVNVIPEKDTPQ